MVRAHPPHVYKPRSLLPEILTTLAFWLRSSVVSVLNSLTTIMGAPLPLLVILFLPPLFPGLCLQPGRRDDLAAALLACVVGGSPLLFLCCSFYHLPFGGCLGLAKEYLGWSSGNAVTRLIRIFIVFATGVSGYHSILLDRTSCNMCCTCAYCTLVLFEVAIVIRTSMLCVYPC
ncbi:hypothetical protein BC834DRAFT_49355 [Gloeopeniophorella convolvens]|nr:hypothetical protein BC834DRAFT_49355 [Gloeopeniophorella convolvens]